MTITITQVQQPTLRALILKGFNSETGIVERRENYDPTRVPVSPSGITVWPPVIGQVFSYWPSLESKAAILPPDIDYPDIGGGGGFVAEDVDDRVAALIVAGNGITKTYDDAANTLTISATGGSSNIKIITSTADLIDEAAATGVVLTRQYWPGSTNVGSPGLFAWDPLATEAVDNGRIFAGLGSPGVGRWVREKFGQPVDIDDYGAIGTIKPYLSDTTFATNGAPQVLLSAKFASLGLAQAWYPQSRILSLTESLNSAAMQQAHVRNLLLSIKPKTYWVNRSIEYYSFRSVVGAGVGRTTILVAATAGAAFVPYAFESSFSIASEVFKKFMVFEGFSVWSDSVKIDYATGNPTTLPAYDIAKSGFWNPPRIPDPAPEAALGLPLLINCTFKNLEFGRFSGNGFSLKNQFSCIVDGVSGDENAGYCVEISSNVGSRIDNCFVGRLNQLGGFNLPNGGSLNYCNGVDTITKDIPWGVVGKPGDVQKVVATFNKCNFEGAQRLLLVHGDDSRISFYDCDFQWYCVSAAVPPLRFFGAGGKITFGGDCTFGPAVNSPVAYPTDFIWVKANGWDLAADRPLKVGSNVLTFTVVDNAGSTAPFGFGSLPIDVQLMQFSGLNYGQYVRQFGVTGVKALQLGRSPGTGETAVEILTGIGAPLDSIGQVGSLYLRQNPVDANTVLYVCTANVSNVRAWVAK